MWIYQCLFPRCCVTGHPRYVVNAQPLGGQVSMCSWFCYTLERKGSWGGEHMPAVDVVLHVTYLFVHFYALTTSKVTASGRKWKLISMVFLVSERLNELSVVDTYTLLYIWLLFMAVGTYQQNAGSKNCPLSKCTFFLFMVFLRWLILNNFFWFKTSFFRPYNVARFNEILQKRKELMTLRIKARQFQFP